jgi:hypothetical protein
MLWTSLIASPWITQRDFILVSDHVLECFVLRIEDEHVSDLLHISLFVSALFH